MNIDVPPRLKEHPYVAAFLKAIAEDPKDLAPPLIFADWLEEHDESEIANALRLECLKKPEPPKPEPPKPQPRIPTTSKAEQAKGCAYLSVLLLGAPAVVAYVGFLLCFNVVQGLFVLLIIGLLCRVGEWICDLFD